MTPATTFESPDAPSATREPLRVAALTVWTGGRPRIFSARDLGPGRPELELVRAAAATGPAWLDLQLDTDVQRWMQPWDPLRPEGTDWGPVSTVASAVGLVLPGGDGQPSHQLILSHLPLINEYGVLRWLTVSAHPRGGAPLVMPLVGFIPGDTLVPRDEPPAGGLEFVLLRVNLAVVGDCLVTIRLTDRLCSGCRQRASGYRLRAADFYEPPDLALLLPAAGVPTATELGDALAGYLAATCSTATEAARERLREIERRLVGARLQDVGYRTIADCHAEMLAIRATLETVDEELLRVSQRVSDAEDGHAALARARHRYGDALRQLDSVEAELRWASDAATNLLTSLRLAEQRTAEQGARDAQRRSDQRQKSLERVIAGLGTALIIATLVPSLFGEDAKLPNPGQVGDFIGMVLVMLGTSGVVFGGLIWVLTSTPDASQRVPRRERRRATLPAALNLAAALTIVAGVLVLLFV